MPYRPFDGQNCSVARALEVIGERWTLMVLRELSLGRRGFREIQRQTGIASNVLADRLRTLVSSGVIERREDDGSEGAAYRLTAKGEDLAPVLWALMAWGDRWACPQDGPPRLLVHAGCGQATEAVATCRCCGEALSFADVQLVDAAAAASPAG